MFTKTAFIKHNINSNYLKYYYNFKTSVFFKQNLQQSLLQSPVT